MQLQVDSDACPFAGEQALEFNTSEAAFGGCTDAGAAGCTHVQGKAIDAISSAFLEGGLSDLKFCYIGWGFDTQI